MKKSSKEDGRTTDKLLLLNEKNYYTFNQSSVPPYPVKKVATLLKKARWDPHEQN